MFKRVLICHDGSAAGLRALKRGAELSTLLKAEVHVLSFYSSCHSDAVMAANAVGQQCLIDLENEHQASLQQCLEFLGTAVSRRRATWRTAIPSMRSSSMPVASAST